MLVDRLESAFRKALYEFELIDEPHIAIALSGGKDSLTLLHLLHRISGRGFPPLNLTAIHVTGTFSCGAGVQLPFLQRTCDQLKLPLIVRDSTKEQTECYSCSRERRRLLFDAAKENDCKTIAFGHHRDDSIETLIMNLLHKGEFAANLPKLKMHKFGITIIRPLIYIAEDEIRRFATSAGFARITCQCPIGQNSKRRQTKDLLDQLEELYPNARSNLARAGLLYGSDKAAH